jgi:hypothetical protein
VSVGVGAQATLMGAAWQVAAQAALVRGPELAAAEARVAALLAALDAARAQRPDHPDLDAKACSSRHLSSFYSHSYDTLFGLVWSPEQN